MPAERKKYKINFLSNVIFRIDFSPILRLNSTPPSEFQEEIREAYVNFENKPLILFEAEIKQGNSDTKQRLVQQYVFRDKSNSKTISVTESYLAFSTDKYTDFEAFKLDSEKILNSFDKFYKPLNITRIGLRYINEIEIKHGNPFEWNSLINKSLLCFKDNPVIVLDNVSRLMSQIIINEDEFKVNFNYGMPNPEFPSRIARKVFVLDYDAYSQEIEEGSVYYLTMFHDYIEQMFENSIEEELRTLMEVIK